MCIRDSTGSETRGPRSILLAGMRQTLSTEVAIVGHLIRRGALSRAPRRVWWSERPTQALCRVLFKEQRLDEVEEAAPNHEATPSHFDALDSLGHHQLVGPGSAEPEHVGCFFYREQQLDVRVIVSPPSARVGLPTSLSWWMVQFVSPWRPR